MPAMFMGVVKKAISASLQEDQFPFGGLVNDKGQDLDR